jgi:hypothetical protein
MARLTESQLAGFRTGTSAKPDHAAASSPDRREPPREALTPRPAADQQSLALDGDATSTDSSMGPVPPAPARRDARQKIGLTLPIDLAEAVRSLTRQGYALSDLVMVAYQHHRDELVSERQATTARKLQRRAAGRSPFTITLSRAERHALDALAHHLDTTRSQTVTGLLERHLNRTGQADVPSVAGALSPVSPRSRP